MPLWSGRHHACHAETAGQTSIDRNSATFAKPGYLRVEHTEWPTLTRPHCDDLVAIIPIARAAPAVRSSTRSPPL